MMHVLPAIACKKGDLASGTSRASKEFLQPVVLVGPPQVNPLQAALIGVASPSIKHICDSDVKQGQRSPGYLHGVSS